MSENLSFWRIVVVLNPFQYVRKRALPILGNSSDINETNRGMTSKQVSKHFQCQVAILHGKVAPAKDDSQWCAAGFDVLPFPHDLPLRRGSLGRIDNLGFDEEVSTELP